MKLSTYLLGAAIVWTGIFMATAMTLSGTQLFGQILPILSAGAVWFVVIVPAVWTAGDRRTTQEP